MYLHWKARKAGLDLELARTSNALIEQALQVGSVDACQTAISIILTGASWTLEREHNVRGKDRGDAIRTLFNSDPIKRLRWHIKLMMYEAI